MIHRYNHTNSYRKLPTHTHNWNLKLNYVYEYLHFFFFSFHAFAFVISTSNNRRETNACGESFTIFRKLYVFGFVCSSSHHQMSNMTFVLSYFSIAKEKKIKKKKQISSRGLRIISLLKKKKNIALSWVRTYSTVNYDRNWQVIGDHRVALVAGQTKVIIPCCSNAFDSCSCWMMKIKKIEYKFSVDIYCFCAVSGIGVHSMGKFHNFTANSFQFKLLFCQTIAMHLTLFAVIFFFFMK